MAIYRNVHLSFWTDNKIEDEFTPEDKYFYLYLLTNPQTNICGCYEVSYSQMTRQTGYNKETIDRLLERFEKTHNVIRYDKKTKEILILNWHRYNWSRSKDTLKGVEKVAEHIKSDCFRKYVLDVVSCIENNAPARGSIDPLQASVTDTDTDSDSVSVSVSITGTEKKKKENYKNMLDNIVMELNISDYLMESVNDWLTYKKERRFTYKESGLRTLLKTVSKTARQYGDEAVAKTISESISSGYQGIVWDKIGRTASKQQSSNSKDEQFQRLMEQIRRDEENANRGR